MSLEDIAPENEEEYQERRESLIEDAAETKQELEQKQTEALAEIAKGEELKQYDTVQLGELDLEVKAWVPGDTADTIQRAMQLAQSETPAKAKESMDTMLLALSDMTVDDTYNVAFWRRYYEEYGPTGLEPAVNTVLEPAMDELEDLQQREIDEETRDAAQGFRTDSTGRIIRSGNGNDGDNAE